MNRDEVLEREQRFVEDIRKGREAEFFLTGLDVLFASVRQDVFREFEETGPVKEVKSCKRKLLVLRIKLEVLADLEINLKRKITDGVIAQEDLKESRERR